MYREIRRDQARPGHREEWVRSMEDVVIPFQASPGMDVTASFVDAQDEDGHVRMRRFEDTARSEALYAAVHEHDRWMNETGPVVDRQGLAGQCPLGAAITSRSGRGRPAVLAVAGPGAAAEAEREAVRPVGGGAWALPWVRSSWSDEQRPHDHAAFPYHRQILIRALPAVAVVTDRLRARLAERKQR